jgi:hypothetical protein
MKCNTVKRNIESSTQTQVRRGGERYNIPSVIYLIKPAILPIQNLLQILIQFVLGQWLRQAGWPFLFPQVRDLLWESILVFRLAPGHCNLIYGARAAEDEGGPGEVEV